MSIILKNSLMFAMVVMVLLMMVGSGDAFINMPSFQAQNTHNSLHSARCMGLASRHSQHCTAVVPKATVEDVEFEKQELAVIFDTMAANKLFFRNLGPEQIASIQKFVEILAAAKMEPRPLDALVGKWRLEFSTESRYNLLPPGVDILFYIYDSGLKGRLDNMLSFWKGYAMRSLRAISEFELNTSGKITFVFTKLEVDLCGWKIPLPIPPGSGGYSDINYLDDTFWIETFMEDTGVDTQQRVYNVYRRIGDLQECDKTEAPNRPLN